MGRLTLSHALSRAAAPWRQATALERLLSALAAALIGLAIAAWLIRLELTGAPLTVLLGWLAALTALLTGVILAWRAWQRLDQAVVARHLEITGGWRLGSISTLLGAPVSGTSGPLHDLASSHRSTEVDDRGREALYPVIRRAHSGMIRMGIVALLAAAALAVARPAQGAQSLLLRPWQAFALLKEPVRLTAAAVMVDRGEMVRLDIHAPGHSRATLLTRSPGEPWHRTEIDLDESGRAAVTTDPLEAELVARAEVSGRRSGEVRIGVRLASFLGSFTLVAEYPEYLSMEREALPADGDTLVVPEGTRLVITGHATTALSTAILQGALDSVPLEIDDKTFTGGFVPRVSGEWHLSVIAADGGAVEGRLPTLPIEVIVDSAPNVQIPIPGADTIAPPGGRFALVVAVEDDYGLRNVSLELRLPGMARALDRPLPMEMSGQDRALIPVTLNLDSMGLGAGDTLHYRAVASDLSPRNSRGQSPEYFVTVPTQSEQRVAQGLATRNATAGLDSLAALARQAERQAEDLARERQRSGNESTGQPMSSESARRAEQAAQTQEEVNRQLEEIREQLGELRDEAQRDGLADSALARQLDEIKELLDRAMTPEMQQAMEELRAALQELNPERTRRALGDLAEQQQKLRETIERARELFERAAAETELSNLAETARELLADQQAATELMATDSAAAANAEDALADRAESLAEGLEQSAASAPAESVQEGLREAAEQSRQAAAEMREAASAAREGKRRQGQQSAEAAGELLEPVAPRIDSEREDMAEAMQAEVIAALDRILAETSRVLSRQLAVSESYRRGAMVGTLRAEESMLEEAVARLLEQTIEVARKNALVSPRISASFAQARSAIRGAIDATSTAAPSLGLASERSGEAVDALAVAAYGLLRAKQSVGDSDSGSGMEEAMQQMQQMAGQQGEISDQGQGMMQEQGDPSLAQMMQLAMQQRALAQQLERMQAQGQLPGAGELAAEAADLARTIEEGRLSSETVARQEQLFRRMLDAGRSLEGDQDQTSEERQGETAESGDSAVPGAIDPALLRGRLPLPAWEELQRLSPDDRRRVLDYFRRLTESGTP